MACEAGVLTLLRVSFFGRGTLLGWVGWLAGLAGLAGLDVFEIVLFSFKVWGEGRIGEI